MVCNFIFDYVTVKTENSFVASVLFARFHFKVIRKIALFLLDFISLVGIPDAQPITSQISQILCR